MNLSGVSARRSSAIMYDGDVSRFDDVFAPTVQLHGFRDGAMQCWPAGVYRDILHLEAA